MEFITESQINAQNDQIFRALDAAAAKKDVATVLESRQAEREGYDQSPRDWLATHFKDTIGFWAPVKQHILAGQRSEEFYLPRAQAGLELIDDALARLAKKTGDRANAARAELTQQRKEISDAIAVFESIGADLTGPLARTLIERAARVRGALAAAQRAKDLATRETVESALLEIEKCLADDRALARDVQATLAALAGPTLPDAADFKDAKGNTEDLQRLPGKNPPASLVARAIQAGIDAPSRVRDLWIIFESNPQHELIQWRWRGASGT
ncbi:MAG TPA: hypothetical protein VER96_15100 [Polyangiaceae bacterium]|nr:hypothetical protein [Polyangiaceae bacterium]